MKALVLLLSLACVCWCKPTTVVSFSPVGYSPGVAPGFAYAFRAPAPLYPSSGGGAGRSLLSGAVSNHVGAPTNVPTVLKTQYHSQDQLGQYAFGYVGDASTAHEVRTKDGAVRGSYTYLDSDGELQTASYVADRNGFRVEATNLPQAPPAPAPAVISLPQPVKPTPEVEAATAAHLRVVEEVKAARIKRAAPTTPYIPSSPPSVKLPLVKHDDTLNVEHSHVPALAKKVVVPATPVKKTSAASVNHFNPVSSVLTPSVSQKRPHLANDASHSVFVRADPNDQSSAPLLVPGWLAGTLSSPISVLVDDNSVSDASMIAPSHIMSKLYFQDELGSYEYSYEGVPSSRQEVQAANGNTRGSNSYIGDLQTTSYVADDLHDFRVLASSLPEGPADPY